MGLLDDAIREHLELKRRNGADLGEVAREEQEALEPIFPEEPLPAAAEDGFVAHDHELPEADSAEIGGGEQAAPEAYTAHAEDFGGVAQETAELDMQAVMDEGFEMPHETPADDGAHAHPVQAGPAEAHREQDSLEWEMPGDAERRPVPEEIPGQERLTFE